MKEDLPVIKTKTSARQSFKRKLTFSRIKRRLFKHVWFMRGFLVALLLLFLFLSFTLLAGVYRKYGISNFVNTAKNFVLTPGGQIKSYNGRTNILILGKRGESDEGPDLTDTMIFASVSHKSPSITLVSLPRDIWMPELRAKLNTAYYWGNQKEPGGGLVLAKSTVEEIVGQPVHYALVIDFSGFKETIDVLGGIEVDVERGFVDNKYPIAGRENDPCGGDPEYKCRYETVKFEKGLQFMDGETALKFVRSRNAEGDEGTDFARAARQEKVIQAIRKRIFENDFLLSFKKQRQLKKAVEASVETDIKSTEGAILARRLIQAKDSLKSFVLPEEFLENPPLLPKYDYLYVFIPKGDDWSKVHDWIKTLFNN
jgi:LCP family protein required for cell wall assembly